MKRAVTESIPAVVANAASPVSPAAVLAAVDAVSPVAVIDAVTATLRYVSAGQHAGAERLLTFRKSGL